MLHDYQFESADSFSCFYFHEVNPFALIVEINNTVVAVIERFNITLFNHLAFNISNSK